MLITHKVLYSQFSDKSFVWNFIFTFYIQFFFPNFDLIYTRNTVSADIKYPLLDRAFGKKMLIALHKKYNLWTSETKRNAQCMERKIITFQSPIKKNKTKNLHIYVFHQQVDATDFLELQVMSFDWRMPLW